MPTLIHHMAALDGTTASSNFPPNSLEAIRACLNANAAVIEVDVTALADEDYLLVHEPSLQTETMSNGAVGECTARDARELHIRHRGQPTLYRVPLLSNVVALFQYHGGSTQLQLDFKNAIPFANDEPLQRLAKLIEPLQDRVSVSSVADWQLRKLRELAPWLNLGFDIHFYLGWRPGSEEFAGEGYPHHKGAYGYWDDHPLATQKIWPTAGYLKNRCGFLIGLVPGARTLYISHHFLAQSLRDGFNWADELHAHNIKLDAWTMDVTNADALANLPLLLKSGVDYITTNTPLAMQKEIQTHLT